MSKHVARRAGAIALGIGLTAGAAIQADDLGTIGPVYPIREPHLLDFIRQRLQEKGASGELAQLQRRARQRGIESVSHPEPVAGLSVASTARTFTIDPSFTLTRNLTDGAGHLLFAAGTRLNPLAIVPLTQRLLFFDARDPRQVKQAHDWIAISSSEKLPIKPVLVGGSYVDLMRAWRMRVYYDQGGGLSHRLGIVHVPALVSQDGMRLRIDERVLP